MSSSVELTSVIRTKRPGSYQLVRAQEAAVELLRARAVRGPALLLFQVSSLQVSPKLVQDFAKSAAKKSAQLASGDATAFTKRDQKLRP